MKNSEILRGLGLTVHEAEIYEILLRVGPAIISKIVEQTGFHRPTVYRALIPLQEKGLVSTSTKGKRKRYAAEPPEKLAGTFKVFRDDFETMLHELRRKYELNKNQPIVKVFEGKEGVRAVVNDLVESQKQGSTYYRYTSKKAALAGEKYLPRDFRKNVIAKQLQRLMITDALAEWQKKPRGTHFHKLLPPDTPLFDNNVSEFIYADKVVFMDFNNETAILIEDPMIADFQKKLFNAFYRLLER